MASRRGSPGILSACQTLFQQRHRTIPSFVASAIVAGDEMAKRDSFSVRLKQAREVAESLDPVDTRLLTWELKFLIDDRVHKNHHQKFSGMGVCPFPIPAVGDIIFGHWIPGSNGGGDWSKQAQVVHVLRSYSGERSGEPANHFAAEVWLRRLIHPVDLPYDSRSQIPPKVKVPAPVRDRPSGKPKAAQSEAPATSLGLDVLNPPPKKVRAKKGR